MSFRESISYSKDFLTGRKVEKVKQKLVVPVQGIATVKLYDDLTGKQIYEAKSENRITAALANPAFLDGYYYPMLENRQNGLLQQIFRTYPFRVLALTTGDMEEKILMIILHGEILLVMLMHGTHIVVNLINNCILHNATGCCITIALQNISGHNEFIIWDDGIGISQDKMKQFNNGLFPENDYKDSGQVVHGFGLKLVYMIVSAHDGNLYFDENQPTGLRVKLIF